MSSGRFLPRLVNPILDISLKAPKCLKKAKEQIKKRKSLINWFLANSLLVFALLYFIALRPAVFTICLLDVHLQSPQGPRKQASGIFSLAESASTSIQVVRTTILSTRDGSYALMHFHHKPHPFSSGQGLGVCKTKSASKHLLKGAKHALHVAQKFSRGSLVCSMQNSQGSDWEREEARWLREEERWLREEARSAAERKDLLEQTASYIEQIKALRLEITQLDSQVKEEKSKDGTLSELIVGLTRLLQSLDVATLLGRESQASSFQTQISSSSSSATDVSRALGTMAMEIPVKTIEMVTAVNQPSILETKAAPSAPPSYDRSKTLKKGAEGDDVKMLQEALAKLGFYSGDDDMEYSSFSSGTERAVRSWQATLGASEDGIVTAELLKKLLSQETASPSEKELPVSPPQGNAAPSAKAVAPTTNSGVKIQDK
ncbi:hypothetical protein L7F22_014148 [Adiantum nelumboides]|nr:hypothetical protein [Adiantum nelumboides]